MHFQKSGIALPIGLMVSHSFLLLMMLGSSINYYKMSKRKSYQQQFQESQNFINKLNKITSSRKKATKEKHHKFETIQQMQKLSSQQKTLEEELAVFLENKLPKVHQEETGLQSARAEFKQNLQKQVFSVKEIVASFFVQFEAFKSTGQGKELIRSQAEKIKDLWEEVKNDLHERSLFLQEETVPLLIKDEETPLESFLDEPVPTIPGVNTQQVVQEYQTAEQKVDEVFKTQLCNIEEPKHNWPLEQHEKFTFLYRMYIEEGKPRERYMERLFIEFPGLSRQDLESHDRVVEKLRWNKKHKSNITKDWRRHRLALKEAAQNLLAKVMDSAFERLSKELEFVKQEKHQKRINKQLLSTRPAYREKLQAQNQLKEETLRKEAEEQKKQENKRNKHLQTVKEQVQKYSLQKQEQNHVETQKKLKEEEQKHLQKLSRIQENKPKVQKRQTQASKRIQKQLENKEKEKTQQQLNEMRIESAIQNYKHLPKVPADPQRLTQHTESLKAKKTKYDKADQVNLFLNTGFTAENLMKDMRYKISSALAQAGLSNTEYGKRVVQAAPAAKAPRKDMASTFNIV